MGRDRLLPWSSEILRSSRAHGSSQAKVVKLGCNDQCILILCVPRGLHHVEQLVALIDRFPSFNDSSKRQDDQDMELMLQNIRSKYRILCSSFGVRPRLQKAATTL